MADAYILCGFGVVHPWLCDAMGHLTTRHYLGFFDDASYQLFAALGHDAEAGKIAQQGWADVRHEIDYRAELAAGALVRIDGRVVALGRSSITTELRLLARSDDRLCATLLARTVCFDLAARRSRLLPEALVEQATVLFGVTPEQRSSPAA
ncbi:MAG: acyl-CoA thioesterase [Pseudomonadota bacterium]